MIQIRYPNYDRCCHIIRLAVPIILGMLSINMMDIVDTAMIGRLGNAALAGTGFANYLFFVSFAVTVGISSAVQTLTSRRLGEGQRHQSGHPLNAGLVIIGTYTFLAWLILAWASPMILPLFSDDIEVILLSKSYFLWRLPGLIALGGAVCFRGFWNGIKQPNTYTLILLGTHGINIFLNWVLIFGHWGAPALGVKGAAMGSTISLYIGLLGYIMATWSKKTTLGAFVTWPSWKDIQSVFRLGAPLAIDQWLFSIFLLVMFWIFGQIGTQAAAVAHVVIACALVLFLPGVGMGMASLSLVSESLGKNLPRMAKQWAWDIIILGMPVMALIGFVLSWYSVPLLSLFIHDPNTLSMAITPFRLDMLMMWCVSTGIICLESLIGAGATRFVMIFKCIMRYGLLLPGAYLLVFIGGYGLLSIWLLWLTVNVIETIGLVVVWHREQWMTIG